MWEYRHTDELYHYGVLGMKWGKRKARPKVEKSDLRRKYDNAKIAKADAKDRYHRDFDYAYNRSGMALSPFKRHRVANRNRWNDMSESLDKYSDAILDYRNVKKERKQAIKDKYEKVQKSASKIDKLVYNDATRKRVAKYLVDTNMTMKEATKKAHNDAWRNTALTLITASAAITVASLRDR